MCKSPSFVIRVDGNSQIGSGHIMRTLALANALRTQGIGVKFITADTGFVAPLEKQHFSYIVLDAQWDAMMAELPRLCSVLEQEKPQLLLVDSYQATAEYLSMLRSKVPVVYFDDFTEKTDPVSGIVHYSIASTLEEYTALYRETPTKIFFGTQYTPLRQEFCIAELQPVAEQAINVLLTVGGADPFGSCAAILNYLLLQPQLHDLIFHPVIGGLSPALPQVKKLAEEFSGRVIIHENVSKMAELMSACDLAISAGGSTLYELCACGVPAISFAYADNQCPNTEGFAKEGIIPYAGDRRKDAVAVIKNFAEYLSHMQLAAQRLAQQQKMRQVVDGKGAERLAAALINAFVE